MVYDAGFVCRCSTITFYPSITEEELYETVSELINMIDYGISFEINPYVVAVPGSEMSTSTEYKFSISKYQLQTGKEITFKQEIIPNNELIAEIAKKTIAGTPATIEEVLNGNRISGDHSMSFGVLAYLLTIVRVWKDLTEVMAEDCRRLEKQILGSISLLVWKHNINNDIKCAVNQFQIERSIAYADIMKIFEENKDREEDLWYSLRMFIDFGDVPEIIGSLKLARFLALHGYSNENYSKSAKILTQHNNFDIMIAAENFIIASG